MSAGLMSGLTGTNRNLPIQHDQHRITALALSIIKRKTRFITVAGRRQQ
jgi:hypothetical protein